MSIVLSHFLGIFIVNTWRKLAIFVIVFIVSFFIGVFVLDSFLVPYLSLALAIMTVLIYDKFGKKKK